MKTTIVIVVGSFISMFLIVGVMFMLYTADPAAFNGVPPVKDTLAVASADTLPHAGTDSLAAAIALAAHNDSAAHAAAPVKKPAPVMAAAAVPVAAPPPADTTDWRTKAKIFDAMSIETATNILMTMNDKEVKQIIPYIKKRNAAKILALFEPDRAARIIR